jgi:hypothetical protein
MVNEVNNNSAAQGGNEMDNLTYKIGDGVTWTGYSDRYAGTVVKVTRTQVHVVEDDATLLNGATSNESDALQVFPGGFVAHVEGRQRYEYSPRLNGGKLKFTLRNKKKRRYDADTQQWNDIVEQEYQMAGATTSAFLSHGRRKHHDYNF